MSNDREKAYWEKTARGERSSYAGPPGIAPTITQIEGAYQERQMARRRLAEIKHEERKGAGL